MDNADDKGKKFFFDLHNFDDDALEAERLASEMVEEEEDLPPPPPVFSEEELETAKKTSFEEGKALGKKEVEESIAQNVKNTLSNISQNIQTLYENEQQRAKIYEAEAVKLAKSLFEKILPHYTKENGFNELCSSIEDILRKQDGKNKITIHVHPDVQAEINEKIKEFTQVAGTPDISFIPDETLGKNACRMDWNDGGAIRDADALAQEIKDTLTQVLAEKLGKGHDNEDIETLEEKDNNTDSVLADPSADKDETAEIREQSNE